MKIKLKKTLSFFLMVVLLFCFAPVMSNAAKNIDGLYVGGTKIERDSYWVNDGSGGIIAEGASSENYNLKVVFEDYTVNLVMNNLSLSGQILYKSTMNIDVVGENTITFIFNRADYISAIKNNGDINFSGNGTLNISAEEDNASSQYVDVYGIYAEDVTFKDNVNVNVTVSTNSLSTDAIGIMTYDGHVEDSAQVTVKTQGGARACCWSTRNLYLSGNGVVKTDAYELLYDSVDRYNRSVSGVSCYNIQMTDSSYIEAINTCDVDNIISNRAVSATSLKMMDQSKIVAKSSDARCRQSGMWSDILGSIAVDVDRSIILSGDAEIIAESGDLLFGYDLVYSAGIALGYDDDKEDIHFDGVIELHDNARVSAKSGDGYNSVGIYATGLYADGNSKVDSVSGFASKSSCGINAKKITLAGNSVSTFSSGDVDTKDHENIFSSTGYRNITSSSTIAVNSNEIYVSDAAKMSAVAGNATVIDEYDSVKSYGIYADTMILTDKVQMEAACGDVDGSTSSAAIRFNNERKSMKKTLAVSGTSKLVATGGYYGVDGVYSDSEYDIIFKDDSQIYIYGSNRALDEFSVSGSPKVEMIGECYSATTQIKTAEDFELDILVSKTADFKDATVWDGSTNLGVYKSLKTDKDTGHHSGEVDTVLTDSISMSYKGITTITPTIDVDSGVDYTVTYSSSDPSIVSVDENGNVSAVKTGSATIIVTVTDEHGNTTTDTYKVEVKYSLVQWLIMIFLFGWIWY